MPSGYFDNEDDLLKEIKGNLESNQKAVAEFRKRFIPYYGNATKQVIDILYDFNIANSEIISA